MCTKIDVSTTDIICILISFFPLPPQSRLSPPASVSASIKLSSNFAPKLTRHCTLSDCREQNLIYNLAPIFCSGQSSQFEKTNYSICKSSKPRKLMENEIRTDNEIFSFHIKTFHHWRSHQSPCSPSNFYILPNCIFMTLIGQ